MSRFFYKIEPICFETRNHGDYFSPELLSDISKHNLSSTLICFLIALLGNFTLNHTYLYHQIRNELFNKGSLANTIDFIVKHKLLILSLISTLLLLFSYFKNKFTSKLITEIHDEEIKNILLTHKDMFHDFVNLHDILCQNITHFLESYKDNGIPWLLHNNISKSFHHFTYDSKTKQFKRVLHSNHKGFYSFNLRTSEFYGYKNISNTSNVLKNRITEFNDTNPFYSTAAINKYISGLLGFNISRVAQKYDETNLLCEEYLKSLLSECPQNLINLVNDPVLDDAIKIQELNEYLANKNELLSETVMATIEYVIDLNTYIHKFRKAFALKTHRDAFPSTKIFDKYK